MSEQTDRIEEIKDDELLDEQASLAAAKTVDGQLKDPLLHDTATASFESLREARVLEKHIRQAAHKAHALNLAIEMLEAHPGKLQPLQVELLSHVAVSTGAQLGHQRAQLSVESYSGDRGLTVRSLTLESFKETLHKVIEWLMKLFRKLKMHIKRVFDHRKEQLDRVENFFTHPHQYRMRRPSPAEAANLTRIFLNQHKQFKPSETLRNVFQTTDGLASADYINSVKRYSADVVAIVDTLLKETSTEEGNWRRHVDRVCLLEIPVPPHFSSEFTKGSYAVYRSIPSLGGSEISFIGASKGNDAGARGARARSHALARTRLGTVHDLLDELHASQESIQDVAVLEDYVQGDAFKNDLHTTQRLITAARKVIDNGYDIESIMEESDRAATRFLKEATHELPSDVRLIITNLIHSLGSISKTATDIIQSVSDDASIVAFGYARLLAFKA